MLKLVNFQVFFPNINMGNRAAPPPVISLVSTGVSNFQFYSYLSKSNQIHLRYINIISGTCSRFCFVHVDDIWWKTILVLLLAPDPNLVGVRYSFLLHVLCIQKRSNMKTKKNQPTPSSNSSFHILSFSVVATGAIGKPGQCLLFGHHLHQGA